MDAVLGSSFFFNADGNDEGIDTHMAFWDKVGSLIEEDNESGPDGDGVGRLSAFNVSLTEGFYVIGITEFDAVFIDGFTVVCGVPGS